MSFSAVCRRAISDWLRPAVGLTHAAGLTERVEVVADEDPEEDVDEDVEEEVPLDVERRGMVVVVAGLVRVHRPP